MVPQQPGDLDDKIRILAYTLWEQAGQPEGRDLEFWDRAKQLLAGEDEPERVSQPVLNGLDSQSLHAG